MNYRLPSTSLVHVPGILRYFSQMYKTDRERATLLVASSFAQLPALCVHDLLAGRIATQTTGEHQDVLEFDWDQPLAEWDAYFGTRAHRLARAVDVVEEISVAIQSELDHPETDPAPPAEERSFATLRSVLADHRFGCFFDTPSSHAA